MPFPPLAPLFYTYGERLFHHTNITYKHQASTFGQYKPPLKQRIPTWIEKLTFEERKCYSRIP